MTLEVHAQKVLRALGYSKLGAEANSPAILADLRAALRAYGEDCVLNALSLVGDFELTDIEMETALTSEGIHVWGPDGERFERMFAVVMKSRAIDPKQFTGENDG